jgi:hypothetical protein
LAGALPGDLRLFRRRRPGGWPWFVQFKVGAQLGFIHNSEVPARLGVQFMVFEAHPVGQCRGRTGKPQPGAGRAVTGTVLQAHGIGDRRGLRGGGEIAGRHRRTAGDDYDNKPGETGVPSHILDGRMGVVPSSRR